MNALTYESAHRELIVGGIKQGLNMREIHKYTPKSVAKTVYLNVFLGALIISQGFYSKRAIQQLSES